MKTQKKLTIFILLLTFMFVLPFIRINKEVVNASSNLQVMKNSSGNDMTYRNSSEKVYGLKEYDYPTAEYRAVWVSTFVSDIPKYTTEAKFKSDATYLLDDIVSMGMNAIVFHVRTHNNALYNSDLNPIATWWVDVDFDKFDPLTWFIDECHKRGLEFHAWMNPYRITDGYVGEPYPEGHPCLDSTQVLTSGTGAKILDPGSTRVQDFIVDTCMEFLDRYDADAIHFDDYFYIDGVASDLSANEKRANVDAFIKKLSDKMKAMNEEEGRAVQLGISPSGIYQNGKYTASPTYDSNGNLTSPIASNTSGFAHYGNYLYSDTKKWIDNEWIDYITPQSYWGMEHSGANFYELSRWWSWCVRYKKVNLYLGVGIYMADGTGSSATYWKKNQNEVQNQILNSGMYDEVKGLCYYKYSYLSSDNSIIKKGVDLIKNDYYKKRIPGAVIQRYENSLPSVKVSNITLNGNILSWDKIDNVFGYMVYQVPKGEILDINNIDYVYEYTQNTSVTNVDTLKYDYYVSSVNRANVKSEPVSFGAVELSDAEYVVALINNLPSTVTLDDVASVNAIRAKYDSLKDTDKALVTNYSVLVASEERISKLVLLKAKADAFIGTLNTKINKSRILPVEANMKWSYVNINDASKYDITTGKRLLDYIAPTPLALYLEVSDNGLTYKQIVEFDLCYLEEGYTGLYYRNDPSSMSELHVGSHTGATSFIGWSNATVTIGKQVLFVAKNNYHELTSSTIPSCNWTSCAGVYVNKSSSNITMTLGQAFETASPTYGYFVIGTNNKIKTVSESSPKDASVTLLPNEALFIIRYLDRLITDNPFTDFTKLVAGTTSYVTYHTGEETVLSEVEKVITLINTLPLSITLNDEELVNSVLAEFNKLSEADQALVTNKDVLTNAQNKISELKQAVEKLKDDAIKQVESYVELSDYSETNQAVIKGYIDTFKNTVLTLKDEASINKALTSVCGQIDSVKNLKEELAEYINESINKLESYIVLDNYSTEKQALITSYINDAKKELESAKTNIEVDQIIDKAKALVNALPTREEEFASYRNELYSDVVTYASANSYSKDNQSIIDNIIYNLSEQLNNANSYVEMDNYYNEAKRLIDEVPTKAEEVQLAKTEAIKSINEYISLDGLSEELKLQIEELITSTTEAINKETSIAKVNNHITTFEKAVDLLVITDLAKQLQQTIRDNTDLSAYSLNNQEVINNLIESISENLTYNTTKEELGLKAIEVGERIATIPTLLEELDTLRQNAINEVKGFIDLLCENVNDQLKAELDNVLTSLTDKVNKATNDVEINSAVDNAKQEISFIALKAYAYEQARLVKESVDFTLYSKENASLINGYIDEITSNITKENTILDIDEKAADTKEKINSVKTISQEVEEAKADAIAYLEGLLLLDLNINLKAKIDSLVIDKKAELANLNTAEEIKALKELTETEVNKIINSANKDSDDKSNCGCGNSASSIILLSALLSCALIILRKKH